MFKSFLHLLPPEDRQRIRERQQWHDEDATEAREMTDETLVSSIQYAVCQMGGPRQALPGGPTYDAHFWHVYLPELLRRFGEREPEPDTWQSTKALARFRMSKESKPGRD